MDSLTVAEVDDVNHCCIHLVCLMNVLGPTNRQIHIYINLYKANLPVLSFFVSPYGADTYANPGGRFDLS